MNAAAERVLGEIEQWRLRFERGELQPSLNGREWSLCELAAVSTLGDWGGLALVHASGDTELVVAVKPQPPTWQDAAGWLKVEGAFAAAGGLLAQWVSDLPRRLTLAGRA